MKTNIENGEQEKMLNQDRFGFSKEATGRRSTKPRSSTSKTLGTGNDRASGDTQRLSNGGARSPDAN
jgi:hypothetical protein